VRQCVINLTVRYGSLDNCADDFVTCLRVNVEASMVPPISKYKIHCIPIVSTLPMW
jgi:hypothetical protein